MVNRTVFDTNIWVSFFLKGRFEELVNMVFDNEVEFYRSLELTRELTQVLNRKKFSKYLTLPIKDYIEFYEELSSMIVIIPSFNGCRDAKDNYLFDIAYQSKSRFLVQGIRT